MGTWLAAGAPQHPSSLPPAGLRDLALPTHLCSAERSPALLPLGAVSTALVGGGDAACPCPCPARTLVPCTAGSVPKSPLRWGPRRRVQKATPGEETGGSVLVLGPSPAVPTPGWPPADTFQVRRQSVPPGRGQGQPVYPRPLARHNASGGCTVRPGGCSWGTPLGYRFLGGAGGLGPTTWACGRCSRGSARPWRGAGAGSCHPRLTLGTGPGLHPGSCARK